MLVFHQTEAERGRDRPRILIVGDVTGWQREGRLPRMAAGLHFADLSDLTPGFLRRLAPQLVISALIATEFDALDVVAHLVAADFVGRYRCVADGMPDFALIRQEIALIAPDLDFGILTAGDLPH